MPGLQCPACSREVGSATVSCPSCGIDLPETLRSEHLPSQPLDFLPGQTFAGRYTIIEKIGTGGMGVVYKAIDERVGSEVALKLIHPVLSGIPTFAERFRREARVARQITHSNVCRVYDIGESDGILHLSMEWIAGETLHQLLRQAGKLSEFRALEIAWKTALALDAAHEKGVVHRDLKPANIMIDDAGQVHVLDFGLALEQGAESLSQSGVVVGTPLYMSPEQRRGETLDSGTDLYSLGLILREMLTGKRSDSHTPTAQLCSGVAPKTTPVLKRLVAERREDRYPTAGAAAAALEELLTPVPPSPVREWAARLAKVGGGLALAGGLAYFLVVMVPKILQAPVSPPIQDARARDFYERGLDRLYEDLETLRGLDAARNMFVRALEYEPDSPIIMARLGEVYWRRYHKVPSAASQAEAEEWLRRAAAVEPSFPELHNAKGYGLIVQGEFEAAKAELRRALDARPEFAMAWANLGWAHQSVGEYAEGLEALDKAMSSERGSFRMHLYRGSFHWHFGEYERAARYFGRATELKGESAMAWSNLGAAMLYLGRIEEAIDGCRRSIEIEDNALARSNLGTAYYSRHEYEESAEHFRRAAELDPSHPIHLANHGDALWVLERRDEARDAYAGAARLARERVEREPLIPEERMRLGQYCALAGDEECALEHSRVALEMQPGNTTFLLKMALIHCVLGRDDESLEWLDRAVKLGASKSQIESYPHFSSLRADPRYLSIVELAS